MSRPAKKPRLAAGTSYHDQVSVFDDFHAVHGQEGRLRRVGNDVLTAPASRDVQFTSDSWQSAAGWAPPDDPEYVLDPDGDWYDDVVEGPVVQQEPPSPPRKQRKKKSCMSVSFRNACISFQSPCTFFQRRPHIVWRDIHRLGYLDEITRWAGRGDFLNSKECPDCISRQSVLKGVPLYRCQECFHPDLVCSSCCIKRHRMLPLHRINVSL